MGSLLSPLHLASQTKIEPAPNNSPFLMKNIRQAATCLSPCLHPFLGLGWFVGLAWMDVTLRTG